MEVKKKYPEDWIKHNLLDIVDLFHGKAHEPYIVPNGRYKVVNSKFVSTEGSVVKFSDVNNSPAEPDDVLMVLSDLPNGKALAKCYYVENSQVYAVNQRVCIYRPRKVSGHFLYYALNRNKYFLALDDGVTQTHILNRDIFGCEIVIPPTLTEQRAIATALFDVDRLLSAYEQLIAKKKAIKQGAMQELLTGRRRLEGFEGEWEERPMNQIAPLQRGFDLPQYKITAGEFPVVFSNGILNHNKQFMVKGPGVVTGRSGTIGQVIFVDKNFWPHNTTLWVTNFYGNDPKFIFYLYRWIGLERFSTGSGVPTLNRNDVHAFKIAIPKINEQTAIAQILTDMDAEIAALEQQREKYKAVKAGMMQELLTGKTRLV
jgi:type I restriction enzyme S subunit